MDGEGSSTDADKSKQQRADTTFAKYLTSPKLFGLQLRDVMLRRQVLVQLLVLFAYLPRDSKFKKPKEALNGLQKDWMDKQREHVEKVCACTGVRVVKPKSWRR